MEKRASLETPILPGLKMAIRPKTLGASFAPVFLGLSTAYGLSGNLNVVVALLTTLCALGLQASTNVANDYFDGLNGIDSEKRNGPTRAMQSGTLTAHQLKSLMIFLFVLSFLLGLGLMIIGGPVIMMIGLVSLYFAYAYTGGPFPLAYIGLGEILAFLFFGPIAVMGTIYLQSKTFPFEGHMLGIVSGAMSAQLMGLNNLRDLKTDQKAGKKTLANMLGEKKMKALITLFYIFAHLPFAVLAISQLHWALLLPLLGLIFTQSFLPKLWKTPIGPEINPLLPQTVKHLLILSILTAVSWVIVRL